MDLSPIAPAIYANKTARRGALRQFDQHETVSDLCSRLFGGMHRRAARTPRRLRLTVAAAVRAAFGNTQGSAAGLGKCFGSTGCLAFFNGSLCDDLLNETLFTQARVVLAE